MPVFAVVPVQHLETAKSRLSTAVSASERRNLVIELLDNVLSALSDSKRVDEILLVSPDPYVLARAAESGAVAINQPGRGLNDAIRIGRDHAVARGADTVLVVLADLPKLTAAEIDDLLGTASDAEVTLAPDRHGHGTNALILRPPNSIEPAFGVDSFHLHRAEAQRLDRSTKVFRSIGTAFDVDTVEDLIELGRMNGYPIHNGIRAGLTSLPPGPGKVHPSRNSK